MNPFTPIFDALLTSSKAKLSQQPRPCGAFNRIENFNRFASGTPKGHALLSFVPEHLVENARRGRAQFFNPHGASLEIVRALNECGYTVDVVSYQDEEFVPVREYDVFIGHDGVNYRRISDSQPESTRRILYATGCYSEVFTQETEKSYLRFCKSRALDRASLKPRRIIDASNYAVSNADVVVCLGQETRRSFVPVAKRVVAINNAAYLDLGFDLKEMGERPVTPGFVYYGGTGNIQKGMDLLIEAFAGLPEARLYLFSPLESEVRQAFKSELRSPNIHFVHHWRFFPNLVRRLISNCTFNVLCGFATGQSTALIAGLGLGLVPVVNREADIDVPGVAITETTVPGVQNAVRRALALSQPEVAALRLRALQSHEVLFKPEAFCASFCEVIRQVESQS